MISIKGLNKYYNKGKQNEIHVINDVTLDLPERGMVAVFGKSGCGKTTLLNVIGGLDSFCSGSLEIEGHNIEKNTDEVRNRYVGYIFQNYNLSRGETCFDNVADAVRLCGITDEQIIKERVMAALENVGMANYAKRTPDTLSGGQQQRIAIARAIVKNPRIILADEPTGNLDQTNTVMIMNLLKAISRDHLVILVTHEVNLVDYYCDKIIEVSDGQIVSVRDNDSAVGFEGRDKSGIYLGEYDLCESSDRIAEIKYYGEEPSEPIKLKIINVGSKIYLTLDDPKVEIIDKTSEIKIHDGKFEQKDNGSVDNIDMSKLPPIDGKRHGRLFSLRSSIRSGYLSNFKRRKKSVRTLKTCMFMFAVAVVVMASIFGTAFKDLASAKNEYNKNVFYVYTPDSAVSGLLCDAVGSDEAAIDFIRLEGWELSSKRVDFRVGTFETFEENFYGSSFSVMAVLLDDTLTGNMELVAGKKSELEMNDILITTKLADVLLEKASVGYITDYDDLIGILSSNLELGGKSARIAGIVRSDENAIYANELALAMYVNNFALQYGTYLASGYDLTVSDGKVVYVKGTKLDGSPSPSVGQKVKIRGLDFEISDIITLYSKYSDWLAGNNIQIKDSDVYLAEIISSEYPEITEGTPEYQEKLVELYDTRYFDYFDYYYSRIDDYIASRARFSTEIDTWLYLEKGIDEIKYIYCDESYYKAYLYKEANGRYPSKSEYDLISSSIIGSVDKDRYYMLYLDEFNVTVNRTPVLVANSFYVSDNDYVKLSKSVGQTDSLSAYSPNTHVYTVLHSTDPKKTEAWLNEELGDLTHDYYDVIITPFDVFDGIVEDRRESISTSLISLVIMLVIMCVCMYFVMRSSLMNRIKEVGIYRAIGVSKRNMVFKFLVEAAVMSALTILVGYLAVSAFICVSLSRSPLVAELIYYPLWYALVVLAVILSTGLVCGILPIVSLLRKTPSEILTKYDI